jgi:hypothetical protein
MGGLTYDYDKTPMKTAMPALREQYRRLKRRRSVRIAVLILLLGLLLDWAVEQYGFGDWPDLFVTTAAFFLVVTGIALFTIGLVRRSDLKNLWRPLLLTLIVSVPLTILYGAFYFGMQYIQTGADRLGECPDLDQAANASNDVPESLWMPPLPAVGCAVERYGIFLSFYNRLTIRGVTDPTAQERILKNLSAYRRQHITHPIRVVFFEKQNWIQHPGKNGASWGERGPEPDKLLRVVNVR